MNLARFSVDRPVTVGIISLALFVLGLFFVSRMPVALYPEVSLPFVSITLPYPGASPEQVEATLIKPLEAELSGLKKLSRVIGFARPNGAQVILAFKMSANEREAVEGVREKVAIARGKFPQGVKEPIVSRIDVGATPVLIFGVETNKNPEETRKILDETLIRSLRRTEGVNDAQLAGLGDKRIELQLDAEKLAQLRVAPLDIYEQLSQKMAVIPWGNVNKKDQTISVARGILPDSLEFWKQETVTLRDGRGVRLGEVGELRASRDEEAPSVFINGERGLGLVITKRADANTVDTVKNANKVLNNFTLPAGMKLFPIIDQSSYVQENAHEVWIALFVGGAFATLIILLFLTDIKSALISATALPVSIAGSFIFMNALGFSLNMMSLLALSLAIGLLIDDAVVVREAIYTEMEKGMSGREAAVHGTDRVASAVLATTLAVIAVFLPVGVMDGLVGQFFKQFGITICISVAISIWVAFTLDPMLSAYFAGHPKPLKGRFWNWWRAFLVKSENRIAAAAAYSFKHYIVILFLSVLALVGASVLVLSRGADFLAFEDRGQFIVNVIAPVGSPKEVSERIVVDAMKRLEGLEGLKDVFATVGLPNEALKSEIRLVFVPKTERVKGVLALQAEARTRLEGLQGDVLVMDPPIIEGVGGEAPLAIYVYGDDLEKLRAQTEELKEKIEAVAGLASARIETAPFGPSLDVTLKNQDLGFAGTQSQAVELSGRLALTGLETGSVGPDNIPFFVRYKKEDQNSETLWNNLLIPTLRGPMFMNQFADAKQVVRPTAIDRERRSRKMVIWGSLDRTRTFGVVLGDVQKIVDGVKAPLFAEIGGDKEVFEDMVESFALAVVGSLFFIFVILAAQFENLLRPFVILLSLPLAVIGGFLALYLAKEQLAMGALIGLILLIGLAAKNGILLVDAIGVKEKEKDLATAVYESVQERSRAILMTSIAMIFGMIPTAIMRGGGSEFRSPMAISIIGGVISSTLLSFLVVPAVFGLIEAIGVAFKRKDAGGKHSDDNPSSKADTPLTTLFVFLLLMPVGYFFEFAPSARAAPSAGAATSVGGGGGEGGIGAAELLVTPAPMPQVLQLVKTVRSDSAEMESIRALETAAKGASDSAELAFLGGARIELGREWYRPGYNQEVNLPLPPQLGGPVNFSSIVVPKAQNVLTLGWQLPLINIQAFEGLKLRDSLRAQEPLVRAAKLESATLANAQLLLQTELALQTVRVNESYVAINAARERTIQQRKSAGLATKMEASQANANLQVAFVQFEQARTEAEKYRRMFEAQSGQAYPEKGLGLPAFPFQGGKPFASTAVQALAAVYRVQEKTVDLADAIFYPSLNLEFGYQGKYFASSPEAQKFAAIKARWDILDGGVRVRNVAQAKQAGFDLLSQKRQVETNLQGNYASLVSRFEGLDRARTAALQARKSAVVAQEQTLEAFRAGLAKLSDVRTADEAKLRADYATLQLEFALQGVALESLILTSQWNGFLANGKVL